MIKTIIFIVLIFIAIPSFPDEVGTVIQLGGAVERSSIITGKRFSIKIGSKINYAQRVRLGHDSFIEILLDNGTGIYVRGQAEILIYSIRIKAEDAPTKLKLLYGKSRIVPKSKFNDRSLILTTPTAVITVVDSSFSVIASEYETKVISLSSKVGIANINPGLKKAYVLEEGEETSVKSDIPPLLPRGVPGNILKFWLDYYTISPDRKYIIRLEQDEGIIDWILRKRDY